MIARTNQARYRAKKRADKKGATMERLPSQRDQDGLELRPVYGCARDEADGQSPIGWARTAGQAARQMRKFLSERDGDDYGLSGADIYFSAKLSAWFTEE